MTTTFSNAFKNAIVNSLTGKSGLAAAQQTYYVGYYSGAQAADPDTTPAGTLMYSSYSLGPLIFGFMSAVAGGVSALSTPKSAAATNAITATIARIYGNGGAAIMDTDVSTLGGGGGVIVPTAVSTAGVQFTLNQFSVKLPSDNGGTVKLNDALRDAIVAGITTAATTIALGSSASIKIYSGSPPANANMAPTGTLLLTLTTAASGASWNTAAGGAASLVSALSAAAAATGTAGYARLEKGTYVLQGSVGTGSEDFIIDTTSIVSAATHSITNATISF
jgi:hypothetical protein